SDRALLVPENLPPRLELGGEATGLVAPFATDAMALEGGLAASKTIDGPSLDDDFAQAIAGFRTTIVDGVNFGLRGRALLKSAGPSALVDAWATWSPFDN